MDSQSYENDEEYVSKPSSKQSNVLQLWGNERTMNLNPLILTNIQSSHYFKVNLYELKTYHEVVDEIYYKVTHLEPWEKGSRRTSGQTGMCGGVRGVGAGGIVSTAYCLLYKLFTLKLTRKQLNGLITHCDSPYIRALGFMYVRHVLPPAHLLDWYGPYLEDEEELDVKAGGGQNMRIGTMLRQFLVELNWYGSLFPRIPVPIEQKIQKFLKDKYPVQQQQQQQQPQQQQPQQAMPMREREQRSDWQRSDRDWKEEKREERGDKDRGYKDDRERHRERNRDDNRRAVTSREYEHKHRDYRDRSPRRERSNNDERNRERSHRHNSRDKEYKYRRDRYH